MKPLVGKIAIAGDILLVLWVTYNAIDSGFSSTIAEKVSFFGLIILMILNVSVLIGNK